MQPKRSRGAQPGNHNAVKHGFYASGLTPAQLCEFWNIVNTNGLDPELAALLVRLRSTLERGPASSRLLRGAAKLLAKWYTAKFGLDKKDSLAVKKYIRDLLQVYTGLHAVA